MKILLIFVALSSCFNSHAVLNISIDDKIYSYLRNEAQLGKILIESFGLENIDKELKSRKNWIVTVKIDSIGHVEKLYRLKKKWRDENGVYNSEIINDSITQIIENKLKSNNTTFTICIDPDFYRTKSDQLNSVRNKKDSLLLSVGWPGHFSFLYNPRDSGDEIIRKTMGNIWDYMPEFDISESRYEGVSDSTKVIIDYNQSLLLFSSLYLFGEYNILNWMQDSPIIFELIVNDDGTIADINNSPQNDYNTFTTKELEPELLRELKYFIQGKRLSFKISPAHTNSKGQTNLIKVQFPSLIPSDEQLFHIMLYKAVKTLSDSE